jgi:hypothetical protein
MSSAEHDVTAVAVAIRIAQPERSVNDEEAGSQSAVNQFKSRGRHNRYLTPHEQGQVQDRGHSNLWKRKLTKVRLKLK